MKPTRYFLALLTLLLAIPASAAVSVDEYVTKTATNATAATVYFEPGPRAAQLVVADVTSDKAASYLNWRVGGYAATILKAVPATVTSNILITLAPTAAYGLNSNIVSVTAAGVVTAHTAGTNSLVTNSLVTLLTPLGTNIAVNDRIREVSSSYYDVTGTSSSNIVSVSSDSTVVNGTVYLLQGTASQNATNTLTSYTTNGSNYDLNFTNALAWTPLRVTLLTTNLYTATLAMDGSGRQIMLDTGTGLAAGDVVILNPATGGTFRKELTEVATYIYQNQTISTATGVALSAGDRLFVLGPNIQTPVGAASLRLSGTPIRVIPPGVPARLTVDGTSAVTINAAIVKY